MDIIVDLFYAILLILAWIWILKYRRIIKWWTWNFLWAEQYIWNGGTYFVIFMFWLFCIFLGVLYPFWGLELIFGSAEEIIKK